MIRFWLGRRLRQQRNRVQSIGNPLAQSYSLHVSTNLILIFFLEFCLYIFATICRLEFGNRFLFGGDRLVVAIDRGLLNQAEEMTRCWRNCKRHRWKTCPLKDTAGCEGLIEIANVI
jgi:hypothetical protein